MGLDEHALSTLEDALLLNPEAGDLIEGTDGARKTRVQLDGRGKSGGGRVIYFDAGDAIYLITAYPKSVQVLSRVPMPTLVTSSVHGASLPVYFCFHCRILVGLGSQAVKHVTLKTQ